jgi:hypothetical protein
MMPSRPKLILTGMTVLAVVLAVFLFVHPAGEERNPALNLPPHSSE